MVCWHPLGMLAPLGIGTPWYVGTPPSDVGTPWYVGTPPLGLAPLGTGTRTDSGTRTVANAQIAYRAAPAAHALYKRQAAGHEHTRLRVGCWKGTLKGNAERDPTPWDSKRKEAPTPLRICSPAKMQPLGPACQNVTMPGPKLRDLGDIPPPFHPFPHILPRLLKRRRGRPPRPTLLPTGREILSREAVEVKKPFPANGRSGQPGGGEGLSVGAPRGAARRSLRAQTLPEIPPHPQAAGWWAG